MHRVSRTTTLEQLRGKMTDFSQKYSRICACHVLAPPFSRSLKKICLKSAKFSRNCFDGRKVKMHSVAILAAICQVSWHKIISHNAFIEWF